MSLPTCTVTVNVDGSAIHFCQGLNLKVIAMNMTSTFPSDILFKILGDILREIVCISLLKYLNSYSLFMDDPC